jgi:hypothetical protein
LSSATSDDTDESSSGPEAAAAACAELCPDKNANVSTSVAEAINGAATFFIFAPKELVVTVMGISPLRLKVDGLKLLSQS